MNIYIIPSKLIQFQFCCQVLEDVDYPLASNRTLLQEERPRKLSPGSVLSDSLAITADQAEMIFRITSAHRKAVIETIPSVAWKTYCLDHEGNIEDPIGKGLEAYLNCARRIHALVRLRFDECGLQGIQDCDILRIPREPTRSE